MLTENDIKNICERIVENIKPLKIYVFGSYIQGLVTDESDIDLFIEVDDERNIFETEVELNLLFSDRRVPMDFLVETRALVEKNRANRASFYSQVIENKARLLYERQ